MFSSDSEREEWFLSAMESDAPPVAELIEMLSSLYSEGNAELADSWAELLQDTLQARGEVDPTITLLLLRDTWNTNDTTLRGTCAKTLSDVLRSDGSGKQFVASSGFDKDIATTEALRRFKLLTQLVPGILCYDKTWGAGTIDRVDTFYAKVTVDFDRKPSHEMSLQYAAEALELLDDDHILALKHNQPEKLTDMIDSDPAALVRLAIRSYGPMNPVQLMETLQDVGLTEDNWKPFWNRARARLKSDPSVDFPTSRTAPISLRSSAKAYDDNWLIKLEEERAVKTITEMLEDLATKGSTESFGAGFEDRIGRRMSFLVSGAADSQPDLVARALVALDHLQIRSDCFDVGGYAHRYLDRDTLFAATAQLPARAIGPFLRFLHSADGEGMLPPLLIGGLNEMHLSFFAESMEFLSMANLETESMQSLAGHIAKRGASPQMLAWLCQHKELMRGVLESTVGTLLSLSLDALEGPSDKRHTKARRQLRQCFERKKWLADALEQMSEQEARDLILRVDCSSAWPPNEKAQVLARMLVIQPDLKASLQKEHDEADLAEAAPRLTSWRSYNERVQQLEKIQTSDIPANAKALAHARSYGDLKENHAYKEAKQQQSILLARRDTLAQELNIVRGSAFDDVPCDTVCAGTHVSLELNDGTTCQYTILGEWDSDEGRGIIACGTKLAQALLGQTEGSEVQIPSETGSISCRLTAISPLPESVRDWVKG